jgi:hypothetical protein
MATRVRPSKSEDSGSADTRTLRDYPPHERDNAMRVHGGALRELGRRHGIPNSTMDSMDEAKLRKQISHVQANLAMETGDALE